MHVAIQSLILQTELSGRDGSVRLLLLWAPYDYSYLLLLIVQMQFCLAWHQSLRACWLKETFPGSAPAACDPLCPVFPSHWGYVGTLWEQLFKLLSFTLFPWGFYQVHANIYRLCCLHLPCLIPEVCPLTLMLQICCALLSFIIITLKQNFSFEAVSWNSQMSICWQSYTENIIPGIC